MDRNAFDKQIEQARASNKSLRELARDSVRNNDVLMGAYIASVDAYDLEALEILTSHPNPYVRSCVAENVYSVVEIQRILAEDDCEQVRSAVASSCFDRDLLRKLAKDAKWRVRVSAVENMDDSYADILDELAKDNVELVRQAVMDVIPVGSPGFLYLATHDKDLVINAIARAYNDNELLAKIGEMNPRLWRAIALNAKDVGVLQYVAKERPILVVERAMRHKDVDTDLLAEALLNCPDHYLDNLWRPDLWQPQWSTRWLKKFAKHESTTLRLIAAENLDVNTKAFSRLLNDEGYIAVQAAKRLPGDHHLIDSLLTHENSAIRKVAVSALSPVDPRLLKMTEDKNEFVRIAVAEVAHENSEAMKVLAKDPYFGVREAVADRIAIKTPEFDALLFDQDITVRTIAIGRADKEVQQLKRERRNVFLPVRP